MSWTTLLHDSATIKRRAIASTDPYGHANAEFVPLAGMPVRCRIDNLDGNKLYTLASREVVTASHKVFLDPDVDITELDALDVTDADGNTVENLNIILVKRARSSSGIHHLEVTCFQYRQPHT